MGYLSDLFVGVGNTSIEERLLHIGISLPSRMINSYAMGMATILQVSYFNG